MYLWEVFCFLTFIFYSNCFQLFSFIFIPSSKVLGPKSFTRFFDWFSPTLLSFYIQMMCLNLNQCNLSNNQCCGSSYEFLEFQILPWLFKHFLILLKKKLIIYEKKNHHQSAIFYLFHTTVLQSRNRIYLQA